MKNRMLCLLLVSAMTLAVAIPAVCSVTNENISNRSFSVEYGRMGIPHEILVYMEANGLDPFNITDRYKAQLATGISTVDGSPLSDSDRRQLEAALGISSAPAAPAADANSATQPAAEPAKAATVEKHEHTYTSEVTKEPTCLDPGEETFTCESCASSYVDEVPALGHDYTEETTTEPTCTDKGEKTFTCSRCEDTYTEEIAAAGHRFSEEFTIDREATCTEDGEQSKQCLVCGVKSEITAIPAMGHTESAAFELVKPATMFADGEESMKCAVCGEIIATRVLPRDMQSFYILIGGIAAVIVAAIGIISVMVKKKKRN